MTELHLRDYQREAIDAVFDAWSGGMRRPAIVLPTGAGKTVVFSALVRKWREEAMYADFPYGHRVMILAHRDELVDQAINKLRAVLPDSVSVGKVKAQDNETTADVMVCSVQTLASARRRERVQSSEVDHGPVGLIITDECHHAVAASYQKIYADFPGALQLGVTATMARGDERGLGDTWEDVVYQRSVLNLISKGYLTDVRTRSVELSTLDMAEVKASRGDWQAGDLGRAMMEAEADTAIARAYREHAGDRRGIVFTPTVETAYAAAQALQEGGVSTAVVSGETPVAERHQAYEDFRTGRVQVLSNCMVLTEGFDAPWAEVAVIARPTRSPTLYTQMVGRVLRPWPGKTEALVLDLVGASAHRLRTLIDLEPDNVRSMRDGESLAEAAIREAEEEAEREKDGDRTVPAKSLAFELKVRDVATFATSDTAWCRTPAGVMFIPCGEVHVFLWPNKAAPGTWNVCLRRPGVKWQVVKEHQGLDLSSAMAWGEAVAEDHAVHFGVARGASWRKKRPSAGAVRKAASYGVRAEGKNAGEVADAINERIASHIFDRFVK